jgi:hypothetical protein
MKTPIQNEPQDDPGHQPERSGDNPMQHPEEQPSGSDGTPKFGRLLIVLISVVLLLGLITYLSQVWYS